MALQLNTMNVEPLNLGYIKEGPSFTSWEGFSLFYYILK